MTPVETKSACKCTFCGEVIVKGEECYRWTGFYEGLFTGTETAHPECYLDKQGLEGWRRGSFLRGSCGKRLNFQEEQSW